MIYCRERSSVAHCGWYGRLMNGTNWSMVIIPISLVFSVIWSAIYSHSAVVPIDRYTHPNDAFAFWRSPDSSASSLLAGVIRVKENFCLNWRAYVCCSPILKAIVSWTSSRHDALRERVYSSGGSVIIHDPIHCRSKTKALSARGRLSFWSFPSSLKWNSSHISPVCMLRLLVFWWKKYQYSMSGVPRNKNNMMSAKSRERIEKFAIRSIIDKIKKIQIPLPLLSHPHQFRKICSNISSNLWQKNDPFFLLL